MARRSSGLGGVIKVIKAIDKASKKANREHQQQIKAWEREAKRQQAQYLREQQKHEKQARAELARRQKEYAAQRGRISEIPNIEPGIIHLAATGIAV